jgi:hypothetical protein
MATHKSLGRLRTWRLSAEAAKTVTKIVKMPTTTAANIKYLMV